MNVDDGLEDIRWICGLGDEKLPAATNAVFPNLKKGRFFAIGESSRNFVACYSLQQRPNVFVSDAWPAHTTYHRSFCEHCDQRWVGAPNEHAPFRFHGTVVGFVDRCLSRIRNLAASNKHLVEFFSGRSRPNIGPGTIFFGVFDKFETFFFEDLCS